MPCPPATLATGDVGLGVDAVKPVPDLGSLAAVATYRLADADVGRRAAFVHLVRVADGEVHWRGLRMSPGPFASTSDLSGVLDLRSVAIVSG
jgi:hypothetical protein